jgi:hypothetical protein
MPSRLSRLTGPAIVIIAASILVGLFLWNADQINPVANNDNDPKKQRVPNPNKDKSLTPKPDPRLVNKPPVPKKADDTPNVPTLPPVTEEQLALMWGPFIEKLEKAANESKGMTPEQLQARDQGLREEYAKLAKAFPQEYAPLAWYEEYLTGGTNELVAQKPTPPPPGTMPGGTSLAEMRAKVDKYPPSEPLNKEDEAVRALRKEVQLALKTHYGDKSKDYDALSAFFKRSKTPADTLPDLQFGVASVMERNPGDLPILLGTPEELDLYYGCKAELKKPGVTNPQFSGFVIRSRTPVDGFGMMLPFYSALDTADGREALTDLINARVRFPNVRIKIAIADTDLTNEARAAEYRLLIAQAQEAGIEVLAGIDTNSGNRPPEEIGTSMRQWVTACPKLQGFFFGRQSIGSGQTIIAYYKALFAQARSLIIN